MLSKKSVVNKIKHVNTMLLEFKHWPKSVKLMTLCIFTVAVIIFFFTFLQFLIYLTATDTAVINEIPFDFDDTNKYLIPRTILLTHRYNLCNITVPSHEQQELAMENKRFRAIMLNVQRIKAFNPDFEIICFNDSEAYNYLMEKNESLAEYFKNEEDGTFKADIFRVVYLYYEGGYYFDSDLEPMMPLTNILNEETTFTTPIGAYFHVFQAYMGSTAFNEILRINMDLFHDMYSNNKTVPTCMGTELMAEALKQFTNEQSLKAIQKKKKYKGQHINLLTEKYYTGPNTEYLKGPRKNNEAFAIYDEATESWPFWSRIFVG